MEFIAFSDESYITAERYRSIGMVSFNKDYSNRVNEELSSLLKESSVSEFKWNNLTGAKYRFCACKLIDYCFKNLKNINLRIDVIIWDTYDSRHTVKKRDDVANFERMFYHLLSFVLKKRPIDSKWYIYPDERLEIDWRTIQDCLNHSSRNLIKKHPILWDELFTNRHFHIMKFEHIVSHENPECQIADLFAGIGVFSKKRYAEFTSWKKNYIWNSVKKCWEKNNTTDLFEEDSNKGYSNSGKYRFETLDYLDSICKSEKLKISLETCKCLKTMNPNSPINFWHYEPQHKNDKAPTKDCI